MACSRLLGTALVLVAASALGADQSTSASCTASLPAGAVELGTAERGGRSVLLRFEGLGVVAPDLEGFQALARCASRSNGDLALRASAPVDAELFTQAVQRIAELVRLAVAEGQPNGRMSVEIVTRADRQPIIEVQVNMTLPRVVEAVAAVTPTQDPAKDPRIAWERAQRYEERLAALKEKEAQLRAERSAREVAAEEAREEQEARSARARFEARERARAMAAQVRRSEEERRVAQEAAALAEEKRKALERRIALRDERLKKGKEERAARAERERAQELAVAKVRAEERAKQAAAVEEVAKGDGAWVQPVTQRELIGLAPPPPGRVVPLPASPRKGEGRVRAGGEVESVKSSAPPEAEPAAGVTKTAEAESAKPLEREASAQATELEPAKPLEREESTKATELEPAKPLDREESTKAAELEPTKPLAREESTKTAEAEPAKPLAREESTKTAEATAAPKPVSDEAPAKTPAVEKSADPPPRGGEGDRVAEVEKSADPLPRGGVGDRRAEVKDALEPLKLAMLAYDQELKLKARKDAEAERVAAARQAALEERQAALAEKASKLKAGKLPAVGAEEKEFAREERERLAEEKRLQAAALALAQKERKQAAEEARLAERARKLKERELTGRDEKAIDAARTARLELEAAAERSRKEQETLAAERLQADEQAMAAREARLTALSKRVELATVKSETLLPGAAGRKQITTALAQTTRDIQRCVEAHLKRFPIAGKTQGVLVLSIDLRGRVSGSGIAEGPLKGSFVESCLRDAAKSWRFPSSDSDFELEVPLTLVGH